MSARTAVKSQKAASRKPGRALFLIPLILLLEDESETALLMLFRKGCDDNPLLVGALLNAGADPNAAGICVPGYDHPTRPLVMAACSGFSSSLRLLIDKGADVNLRGAQLVGEVVQYEDAYRLCYIRGPEGILIGLAEQLG